MAQGTLLTFEQFLDYLIEQTIDLDVTSGRWAAVLLSDPITSLLITETNPALNISTNINEVAAGGNYAADGIALTLDNARVNGVWTMKLNTSTHSGGKISWAAAAGSPTNIKSLGIVDLLSTTDLAIAYADMTADGGLTPVSMVADPVAYTFGADGTLGDILTLTRSA